MNNYSSKKQSMKPSKLWLKLCLHGSFNYDSACRPRAERPKTKSIQTVEPQITLAIRENNWNNRNNPRTTKITDKWWCPRIVSTFPTVSNKIQLFVCCSHNNCEGFCFLLTDTFHTLAWAFCVCFVCLLKSLLKPFV